MSIAKLKSCRGRDGECFSCDLIVNGKRAGTVENSGSGGCNFYHWDDQEAGKACEEYAASHNPEGFEQLDRVVAEIIDREEARKTFLRKMKTCVVYTSPEIKEGDYFVTKTDPMLSNNPVRLAQETARLRETRPNGIFAHENMDAFLAKVCGPAHPFPVSPK